MIIPRTDKDAEGPGSDRGSCDLEKSPESPAQWTYMSGTAPLSAGVSPRPVTPSRRSERLRCLGGLEELGERADSDLRPAASGRGQLHSGLRILYMNPYTLAQEAIPRTGSGQGKTLGTPGSGQWAPTTPSNRRVHADWKELIGPQEEFLSLKAGLPEVTSLSDSLSLDGLA